MQVFFETKDQAVVVLAMLITGFASGFLYDFLSAFKKGQGRVVCAVADVIIFMITGLLAAAVLVYFAQARVRTYHIIGLVLGGALYIFLPHRMFVKIGNKWHQFKQKRVQKNLHAGENEKAAK